MVAHWNGVSKICTRWKPCIPASTRPRRESAGPGRWDPTRRSPDSVSLRSRWPLQLEVCIPEAVHPSVKKFHYYWKPNFHTVFFSCFEAITSVRANQCNYFENVMVKQCVTMNLQQCYLLTLQQITWLINGKHLSLCQGWTFLAFVMIVVIWFQRS